MASPSRRRHVARTQRRSDHGQVAATTGQADSHPRPLHSDQERVDPERGARRLRTSARRAVVWFQATPNIGHPTGPWFQDTLNIGHRTGHVDPDHSEHRPPDRSRGSTRLRTSATRPVGGSRPLRTSATRPVTWIHATPNIGHLTGHLDQATRTSATRPVTWIQATPNIGHPTGPRHPPVGGSRRLRTLRTRLSQPATPSRTLIASPPPRISTPRTPAAKCFWSSRSVRLCGPPWYDMAHYCGLWKRPT